MKLPSYNKIASIASYATFWGWNCIFLLIAFFGIMPWFLFNWRFINAVISGELPLDFLISIFLLVLIPVITLWIAMKRFDGQPNLQIRLFYGVEAPIFLLCLLRLFLLRELTLGSAFIIGTVLFAAFIYARHLLQSVTLNSLSNKTTLSLNSFLLIIALYVGALLIFLVPPIGWSVLKFFLKVDWLNSIFGFGFIKLVTIVNPLRLLMLWWIPFGFLFFFFSVALFVFSPIMLVRFYGQAWLHTWRHQTKQISLQVFLGITSSVIAIWLIIFVLVDYQPQIKTFEVLATPSVKPSLTQKQKKNILNNAEDIRKGLLNAYLYRYRYLNVEADVNGIQQMYALTFGLPGSITKPLQNFYNILLSPVIYKGDRNDDKKAADLYASIFDTPIQKGEKAAITDALEATYDRDQLEAGLLNINQQKVWLAEQQISVTQKDAVTNIELYEVYENKTSRQQEIFYYFSLPENAAITGLWLENSPYKEGRQAYTISPRGAAQNSPRGAAQKVYGEQVRDHLDPALLEQVGPRQYRLRAFPIPGNIRLNRFFPTSVKKSVQTMHLWLTYSVLNDGKAPIFPELLEKRNVYWSDKTERIFNGSTITKTTSWIPNHAKDLRLFTGFKLPIAKEGYLISAQPVSLELLKPESSRKVAILIDTSYSMNEKKKAIRDSISLLQKQNRMLKNDLFINPIHEKLKKITPQDITNLTFFGTFSDSDLWNQAVSLQKQDSYDAVFILSDQGSYELGHDKPLLKEEKSPVWFVHLDKLSPAYEDNVMSKIFLSHGGVAVKLEDAYQQFLMQQNLSPKQRVHGGILWDFSKAISETKATTDDFADPLAAKMLIDYIASQQRDLTLESLDNIHQIAKRESVVTPYSSMIVLVNDQQKEQLKKAEQEKDRFDRVVDKGIETLTNPMVSAVPEPETWILLILSLVFLCALVKRQRNRLHSLNFSIYK